MPPLESRQLDDAAHSALIAYLRQDVRTEEDDALLKRAAQLGMASTHTVGVRY